MNYDFFLRAFTNWNSYVIKMSKRDIDMSKQKLANDKSDVEMS